MMNAGERFSFEDILFIPLPAPNGLRYPLVGGTRERHFTGTNLKPPNVLENAPTPTIMTLMLLQGSGARCVGRIL